MHILAFIEYVHFYMQIFASFTRTDTKLKYNYLLGEAMSSVRNKNICIKTNKFEEKTDGHNPRSEMSMYDAVVNNCTNIFKFDRSNPRSDYAKLPTKDLLYSNVQYCLIR